MTCQKKRECKKNDVLLCAPWSRCTDPSEPHAVKLTDFPAMAPSKESSLSSTAEAAATSASNAKTLTDIIMLNSAKKIGFHTARSIHLRVSLLAPKAKQGTSDCPLSESVAKREPTGEWAAHRIHTLFIHSLLSNWNPLRYWCQQNKDSFQGDGHRTDSGITPHFIKTFLFYTSTISRFWLPGLCAQLKFSACC